MSSFHRLSHASLISGLEGIGRFEFAVRLAMSLICESDSDRPCGKCKNCHLFSVGNHPDLHVFTSETVHYWLEEPMSSYAERYLENTKKREKRKNLRTTIGINQIRALIDQGNTKAHLTKNKVFILNPVDAMTISAANSLLKILEEPAPNNFLILISSDSQQLLPTITSRCQKIPLRNPNQNEVQVWLKEQGLSDNEIEHILISGLGPLAGLRSVKNGELKHRAVFSASVIQFLAGEFQGDILSIADLGLKIGEIESLIELQSLAGQMIRISVAGETESFSNEPKLAKAVSRFNINNLFHVYDKLCQLREFINIGNPDKALAIEDALLAFARARN